MEIKSFSSDNKKELKRFVRFPKHLYKDDPNYVKPLKSELLGSRLLGASGLLTSRHPYHKHSVTKYFIVEEGKDILGRIAATVNYNHNKTHNESIGFFGFFESIDDDDISSRLFDAASEFLRENGMEAIRGPASFSLNDICGLLIDGFDTPPYLDMGHNPSYYQELIENYGFDKVKDLLAYKIDLVENKEEIVKKLDRIDSIVLKANKKGKVRIRNVDFDNIEEDFNIIRRIYNEAWKDNWGHDPLTKEEFDITASNLKRIANPKLIYIGYYNDEPVAFYGAIPNLNQILIKKSPEIFRLAKLIINKNKIDQIRMMLFGILSGYRAKGIDAFMFAKSFRYAMNHGFKEAEISWLLEDNVMVIRPTEYWGGEVYKRYRMYEKRL